MTAQLIVDNRETSLTQRRYDRIAPIYDTFEWMTDTHRMVQQDCRHAYALEQEGPDAGGGR